MDNNPTTHKHIILYDGDCPLCNYWVDFVLKRDRKDKFLFASLQSSYGQEFLAERNISTDVFNTIYLVKPQQYYYIKSRAISKIFQLLGGIYSPLSWLKYFPKGIADSVYDLVAKNRKKIHFEHCPLITGDDRKKFLTDTL